MAMGVASGNVSGYHVRFGRLIGYCWRAHSEHGDNER
jgi:hypothetical protein